MCTYSEFVEIIVFEGLSAKVWLKVSQRLVIRNFLQRVKHGSLFTEKIQVCIIFLKNFWKDVPGAVGYGWSVYVCVSVCTKTENY